MRFITGCNPAANEPPGKPEKRGNKALICYDAIFEVRILIPHDNI
jgi:hypothetical protein